MGGQVGAGPRGEAAVVMRQRPCPGWTLRSPLLTSGALYWLHASARQRPTGVAYFLLPTQPHGLPVRPALTPLPTLPVQRFMMRLCGPAWPPNTLGHSAGSYRAPSGLPAEVSPDTSRTAAALLPLCWSSHASLFALSCPDNRALPLLLLRRLVVLLVLLRLGGWVLVLLLANVVLLLVAVAAETCTASRAQMWLHRPPPWAVAASWEGQRARSALRRSGPTPHSCAMLSRTASRTSRGRQRPTRRCGLPERERTTAVLLSWLLTVKVDGSGDNDGRGEVIELTGASLGEAALSSFLLHFILLLSAANRILCYRSIASRCWSALSCSSIA